MKKYTVDDYFSLSIFWLNRNGLLKNITNQVRWRNGFGNIIEFLISSYSDHIFLSNESLETKILLEKTKCYFGGFRSWFLCPFCNKRVAKLYFKNEEFACRNCHQLTYTSCQSRRTKTEGLWRMIQKIRKRGQFVV